MNRTAVRDTTGPAGLRVLLPVFIRTRGSWWTGIAAALAAAVVVLLHAVTQGLTLSPAQQAEGYFGEFEFARHAVADYALGTGPGYREVVAALEKAGATDAAVSLYVVDIGQTSGHGRGEVRFEELDLTSAATSAVRMDSGTAPSATGEACISPSLANRLDSPSNLDFFDGALKLTITCVATDDQARDIPAIYAAPGTWAAAGTGLSEDALRRWGVKATANVLWSGGDPAVVDAALATVVRSDKPAARQDGVEGGVESAAAMRERPRGFNAVANAWAFLIPSWLVPALTSAVASWGGARLLSGAVDTLVALGLRRTRTRQLTLLLPLLVSAVGALTGVAVGVLLGAGVRSWMGATLSFPVGPWVGLPVVTGIVLVGTTAGVVMGTGLALLRLNARVRQDLAWARRPRLGWPSTTVLLGLMALCGIGALLTATAATTMTLRVAAVTLFGLAAVFTVLVTLGLRSQRGLAGTPSSLLRSRSITAAGGTWLIMLLFGLQAILTTGTITLVTSGVQTFNASLVSAVPDDQARLDLLNMGDAGVTGALVGEVREALAADEDFSFRYLETSTRLADGAVVVVGTPRQAADVLGLPTIPPAAAEALTQGGAVRGGGQDVEKLTLVDPAAADPSLVSAEIATLPVMNVEGAKGTLASGGAVVLSSTAEELSVPVTREIAHVFPRLSPAQRTAAARIPEDLRFNPEWMQLPKPPDIMPVPPTVGWGAAVLSAVNLVVALVYGLQAGAAGRRVLAGARAMGLRPSWVRLVLGGQMAWVVLAPTVAGVLGSALGVIAVTTLHGHPLDLYIPWEIVGMMAVGTLIAFVGATWLALRDLDVRERLA